MNTIADSLKVKGDRPRLLFELIDRYHNQETFETIDLRILRIGDVYGFIFGTGVISNFLELYYGTGAPSPAMAAKLLGQVVISAVAGTPLAKQVGRRVHARVIVDGKQWAREDFLTVAASCVEEIGLRFKPFYRAHERADAFPILGIHASTPGLATELPTVLRGRPMSRHKVIDALAREVVFETDEPTGYTIDGDLYKTQGSLKIVQGPALRIVKLTGQAVSEAPL